MSEPELYMADSNESFDLPRWQTQVDPLSSSVQAAHAQSASAYIYPAAPPPPPQSSQRLQTTHQGQVLNRQSRISQLLEQEQSLGSPYASTGQGQLTRSTSLGGTAGGNLTSSRSRRHHQPDDLEGAFNSDNQVMNNSRQQPPLSHNSFYPASVGYQPPSMSATGSTNPPTSPPDPYSDIYYNGSASQQPPKRLQPAYDNNNLPANRGGRSPLRVPNTPISASPLDQYSHQSQYSPTTASYPYNNTVDQRTHPGTYQSHSRNHSQVKNESLTPPIPTAYSSQTNLSSGTYSSGLSGNNYPSSYSMETSSPHPPIQSHVNPQAMGIKPSISTPSTPLSYLHPSSGQGSHYYPQDHSMAVDPPPKRRAPGFRRVRTVHDLQPRLDVSPLGRRMGADGVYLAVGASNLNLKFDAHMLHLSIAITIANHKHPGYISHM